MIDRRRLWSAIRTVMVEDEFLVRRRDFPRVRGPALPGVDEELIIRGLSDFVPGGKCDFSTTKAEATDVPIFLR